MAEHTAEARTEGQKQTSMTCQSVREFTGKLAGKDPVPGGGGAAAVAAALGAALGSMTANLAVGKKRYADHQEELTKLTQQLSELIDQLLSCVDKDAENFLPLLEAYKLPHGTSEETQKKDAAIEAAIQMANEVPLSIMRLCLQALNLIGEAEEKGSRMAISDAAAGARLAGAAIDAAALNVYINTRSMKDREKAQEQQRQADEMTSLGAELSDAIYRKVLNEIRG
ncbi:MAG: cyclodeaminase/cyclohydrolase family protein [Lachnospiraceae bacterium]|jgi:formiminotetrahydrofolate cyclodeaminase|nr:cyclodeaminase/cyclohydrolase family protein [Lachnospiraceae bacterium]MCH4069950.1 cyclodeaminase/cyclohydrolase family protein [Lachnospiraceae bacterium]MCH4108699.1 cyclodeaminase/cyclohydrolase family protein [Lachnospiraceae bacterium]MCI1303241.1 cyclodeaminase/cyclohydrolase family protein [Lachnospiraceae bacterium]MCI1332835.1 cyclodeaminase/cyclohydrolase family protein [Lachnospiraceae bacterium]